MPAKKPPTKNTAKKASGPKTRVVSDTHKAAMAAGRDAARAVNAYLTALEDFRPKRGRKVSKEDLDKRLAAARADADQAIGTARLLALQLADDLENKIAGLANSANDNLEQLEESFAKAAKTYADSKGISYATWRKAGVPAELLRRAGITRGS
jgi:hypothetical protein